MQANIKKAFQWIVDIIKTNGVPFYVSGGIAANVYGADRPIFDIDIEIPDQCFDKIFPLVKDFVIYGPRRYMDANFDILLMTLEYEGQRIDISGCTSDKLYDRDKGIWEFYGDKISNVIEKDVYGLKVPVINRQDLIEYKKKIKRPTDLEDVIAIKKILKDKS